MTIIKLPIICFCYKISSRYYLYFQGEYVWVEPITKDIFELPFAGKIQRTDKERILIIDDDDQEIWINSKQIMKTMHTTSSENVEDMIMLGDLQEYAILRNLSMRYKKKEIYVINLINIL